MTLPLKVMAGAAVIALATGYLAYLGAATSWRYYVLVDECVAHPADFVGERLRVSGRVAKQSLAIRGDRQLATFTLQGQAGELPVACRGPLPDNLAEDMEVVVEGTLASDGRLQGDKVMTRCASKYQAGE